MQDVHVKLNSGLPWQNEHSTWDDSFHQQTGHKFKAETSKVPHLGHSFLLSWNVDTSESRSKITGTFWNVVLEEDGNQLDRSCEKWRSITYSQGKDVLYKIKWRKANWIGHILRRNCLVNDAIEGKLERRIEVMVRWGGRRKQLLDGLKETKWYWKLKEETLDRTLWRTRFA
jgi:hypothetical protein